MTDEAIAIEQQVVNRCQEAGELMDHSLNVPWDVINRNVDQAERMVVGLRNVIIDELRRTNVHTPGRDERLHTLLGRINLALTLLSGIEYPSSGIRPLLIEETRDYLRNISN